MPAPAHCGLGWPWWLALVVAIGVYLPGLQGPFIFDDVVSLRENLAIRELSNLPLVLSGGANNTLSGRPLMALSFALNYAAFEGWAPGYRITNIAIHLLGATVLLCLLMRLLPEAGIHRDRVRRISLLASVIWLLHPLATQSVTYVVQRGETLVALFSFLYLRAFLKARASGFGNLSLLTGWLACAAAFASKESAAFLPAAGLALDIALDGSRSWTRGRSLFHGGAFLLWLPLAAVILSTDGRSGTVGFGLADTMTGGAYATHQLWVIPHYLSLFVWPSPLILHYGPVPLPSIWVLLSCGAVLTLLGLASLRWVLRRQPLGVLGVWYLAFLVPSSSFIPINDVAFQHRPHTSNAAAAIASAVFLDLIIRRVARDAARPAFAAAGVVTAIVLASMTSVRNHEYRSAISIWQQTVEVSPGSPSAWLALGFALQDVGRAGEAIDCFKRSLELRRFGKSPSEREGNRLYEQGKWAEAIEHFDAVLTSYPSNAAALSRRGMAKLWLLDAQGAFDDLDRVVRIAPALPESWCNRALARIRLQQFPEALKDLDWAIQMSASNAEAHVHRGVLLFHLGREVEGEAAIRIGLRIDPSRRELLPRQLRDRF